MEQIILICSSSSVSRIFTMNIFIDVDFFINEEFKEEFETVMILVLLEYALFIQQLDYG